MFRLIKEILGGFYSVTYKGKSQADKTLGHDTPEFA